MLGRCRHMTLRILEVGSYSLGGLAVGFLLE